MTEWHPLPLHRPNHSSCPAAEAVASLEELNRRAEQRARAIAEPACMPSLNHLSLKDFDDVYEPSDDTFLLIDGLQLALKEGDIDKRKIDTTLELGCGTGVPTVFLARQLQLMSGSSNNNSSSTGENESNNGGPQRRRRKQCSSFVHIVTDVNPFALQVAVATAAENDISTFLEAVECDLASALLPRCQHSIDVLLFNPPYVPTPNDEVRGGRGRDNMIEASWAGGFHGRVVIDRAIPQMAQLLSKPHGVAYIITVDDNLPLDLQKLFHSQGLNMTPWVRRRARNEYLTVQRLTWRQQNDDYHDTST